MNALQLRRRILRHFAEHGTAPGLRSISEWGVTDPVDALRRLHDAHAVVLDESGGIMMAHPFSGVPTRWLVRAGDRSWFANCAWDAIAIPVALGIDAAIEAPWRDGPGQVGLALEDGRVRGGPAFVYFAVPARHWWDDIVHT